MGQLTSCPARNCPLCLLQSDPFVQHCALVFRMSVAEYNAVTFRALTILVRARKFFVRPGSGSSRWDSRSVRPAGIESRNGGVQASATRSARCAARPSGRSNQLSARLRLSVLGAHPPAGGRAAPPGTGRVVHSARSARSRPTRSTGCCCSSSPQPTNMREGRSRGFGMRMSPKRRPRPRLRSRPRARASSTSTRRCRCRPSG